MSVVTVNDSLVSTAPPRTSSDEVATKRIGLLDWLASKFTAGSIKGSILELISATIGAGVLTLPYAFGRSGLSLSIIQALICAGLGFYSTRLLAKCGDLAKKYSYAELAEASYGPVFVFFVKLIFFLNNWGGCVIYTILITNLLSTSVGMFFPDLPNYLTDTNSLVWPPIYTTLIILPLSLNRDLSALRYTCLTGFLFIMYLAVVVIYQSNRVSDLRHNFKISEHFVWSGIKVTFPTVVFSFSCHPNVLDVYHELQRSSMRRMTKVLFRTMFVACLVFLLVGSFGYLTFTDKKYFLDCPQNILLSFRYLNWPTSTVVALLCIGFTIILAMPLSIKPSKDALRALLISDKPTKKASKVNKGVKADLSKEDVSEVVKKEIKDDIKEEDIQRDINENIREETKGNNKEDIPEIVKEDVPENIKKDLNEPLLNNTEAAYQKKKDSTALHVSLVVFVVYSQMICGMFAKSMASVITLLGASAYPLICYCFPCLFFLKLDKSHWYSPQRLFAHLINILMFGLAVYCTVSFFTEDSDFC